MSILKFYKEKYKNPPSQELFYIIAVIICVIILESFTDWDEELLSYLYANNAHPWSDLAINTMLAGLLFSIYSIRRFFEYRQLIKKRNDVESHLKASQEKLDIILNNSSTIIYSAIPRPNAGNNYISPNVKSIFGYEPEEFYGSNFWFTIIHPEDTKKIKEAEPDLFKNGHAENELRIKHKDGSWRWVYNKIKLQCNEKGEPEEIIGSWLDITEKRKAEEEIRKSEERFQLAAKASKDIIYDWNIITGHCWTNEHFALFGNTGNNNNWDLDKFIEKIHPDDRPVISQSIAKTLEKKIDYWLAEFRLIKLDGTYASFYSSACIIYSDEGVPVRWIGSMYDITSLKEIETQLRQAKEKAEESTKTKSEFLANMSHEIRTPLNGIIGMTELTLETNLTPQQERYLNIVKSSSETLMGLINDVLDFSKIDAGKLELSSIPFSLREEVPKSLQALGLKAAEKGLEFIFRLDADVPDLFIGDVLRLQQIIMNLAGNAIKFTERGEVILHVQLQSTLPGKIILQFSVTDTGIGIPPHKLSHIFNEFTQVDNSTSRKYGGTGLGLAITKRLVELMGGSVWAESVEGKGSNFQFSITLKLQENKISHRAGFVSGLKNKSVLVIQGNKSACDYSKELLSQFGIKPVIVRTGELGLAELKKAIENKHPYSLVLLDTKLAGQLDGFGVAEEIKKDACLHQTPVMIVSMSQKASDREWFAQLGFIHFLSKPFSPSDLLDNIQNLLAENKLLHQSEPEIEEPFSKETEKISLSVLLAEDNIVNQEVALSMLARLGHKVKIVPNGKEAITAAKKELFDIILMDVQMPLMDGYEATKKIRELEKQAGKHVYIIGLTANAMSGDKEKCLQAGMDDYISKPVHLKDLTTAFVKTNFEKEKI